MKTLALAAAAALSLSAAAFAAPVQPLPRAHAHNDYEHERPLFDALDHGFTSVEADIWLVDGEFLVAHDDWALDPSRTLKSLYLDPLRDLIAANGGSVYGEGTPLNLLIDVKSEAVAAWSALDGLLAEYSDVFTAFSKTDGRSEGAVTAHISGNRDYEAMKNDDLRYAGYDGRASDLESGEPLDPNLITMVSNNWTSLFDWNGSGEFSAEDEAFLADYVSRVHENGQIVRFWATNDTPGDARDALWAKLVQHNVDLINTDDLAGLQSFLLENDQPQPAPVPLPAGVWLLGGSLALIAGLRRRRRA
ncbi:hypothetical protein [Paracoccus sp. S3-43]|uniref:hypothetical protein n=1 Tax=Paracoccus sp. S3-43 TaxID=3030011 RepID=UPI0023AFAA0F|nr:hypothetical protein [Paracoccus sp. S3-43]WEF25577.1 hypothetical protein PXD02_06575 [Paracoccus sp. S3-43]